jgi:hypothetical protein
MDMVVAGADIRLRQHGRPQAITLPLYRVAAATLQSRQKDSVPGRWIKTIDQGKTGQAAEEPDKGHTKMLKGAAQAEG